MKTYKCPFCGEHPRVIEQGCACLTESCPMFCKVCNVYDWNNRLSVDNPKKKPQIQWTTDPPTVEGFYWVRRTGAPKEESEVAQFLEKFGLLFTGGYTVLDWKFTEYQRSTEPMEVPE